MYRWFTNQEKLCQVSFWMVSVHSKLPLVAKTCRFWAFHQTLNIQFELFPSAQAWRNWFRDHVGMSLKIVVPKRAFDLNIKKMWSLVHPKFHPQPQVGSSILEFFELNGKKTWPAKVFCGLPKIDHGLRHSHVQETPDVNTIAVLLYRMGPPFELVFSCRTWLWLKSTVYGGYFTN